MESYFGFLRKIAKNLTPMLILLGIFLLLLGFKDKIIVEDLINDKNSPYILMGTLYLVIGIGTWVYKFIESGDIKTISRLDSDFIINRYQKKLDELKNEISDNILNNSNTNIDSSDLDNIIKEKITFSLDYTLKEYLESKYSSNIIKKKQLKNLNLQIKDLQTGVNIQIGKLSRSGTINLIIGLFTTLIAIGILIYLILDIKNIQFTTTTNFLIYLIPRISLAIFIEVFSFFFLKLYKTNLEDVKYFQNERTNIDSKIIALKTSIYLGNDEILEEIIRSFSQVERNFILKKGESTVNIEKLKLENQQDINVISKLSEFINNVKK